MTATIIPPTANNIIDFPTPGSPEIPSWLARKEFVVVELFADAGGGTSGAVRALKPLLDRLGVKLSLTLVNHWFTAIETLKGNFPYARLFNASVENLSPRKLVPGGIVNLLIAAPECVMFSSARGNRPIQDQRRSSAAYILDWVSDPDVLVERVLCENVREWSTWGPLDPDTMRPIKGREGEFFDAFLSEFRKAYVVDWSVENAANFGDCTSRVRLFIQAVHKSLPSARRGVRRPQQTHAKNPEKHPDKNLKAWRAAREIINRKKRGTSVFNRTQGPHSPKSLRRTKTGFAKQDALLAGAYVESVERYIPIAVRFHAAMEEKFTKTKLGRNPTKDERDTNRALTNAALMQARLDTAEAFATPCGIYEEENGTLVPSSFTIGQHGGAEPRTDSQPIATVATKGAIAHVAPFIAKMNAGETSAFDDAIQSVDEPIKTIVTKDCRGYVEPQIIPVDEFLVTINHGATNCEVDRDATLDRPLHTITTKGSTAHIQPVIVYQHNFGSDDATGTPEDTLPTITANAKIRIVEPCIVKQFGTATTTPLDKPIGSLPTSPHYGLAEPYIVKYYGEKNGQARVASSLEQPLPTIPTANRFGVIEPFIVNHGSEKNDDRTARLDDPTFTATTRGAGYVVDPVIISQHDHGRNITRNMAEPLLSPTTRGAGQLMYPGLDPNNTLRPYILIRHTGDAHFTRYDIDILFRMLSSEELLLAMSLSDESTDYFLAGGETDRLRQIGNAIAVGMARALIHTLCADVFEYDNLPVAA